MGAAPIQTDNRLRKTKAVGDVANEILRLEFVLGRYLAQRQMPLVPNSELHRRHLWDVVPRQLYAIRHRSLQLPLWEIGENEWLKVARLLPSL